MCATGLPRVGFWADGTRHLIFEPLTLLEKLAALTPRPRIDLVLYHGVLAPHAAWRARVIAYGAPRVEAPVAAPPVRMTSRRRRRPLGTGRGRI